MPPHRRESLDDIKTDIGPACTRCKLCTLGRSQIVFGVGHPKARLMFVGEAPGEEEDKRGEPFVGRAGQLLTKIIEAIGLSRDQVYIANVIKCRPPNNRNPEPDEVAACEPFLFRQIDVIQPAVIVPLGKFAAQCLLKTTDPITKLRGRQFDYRGTMLIPTFHPAYLLRNPSAKREVWEDMKMVRDILQGDASAEHPVADRLMSVAVPVPALGLLTYRVPDDQADAGRRRARRRAARAAHADRRRRWRSSRRRHRLQDQDRSCRSLDDQRVRPAGRGQADRSGCRSTTLPARAPRWRRRCRRMD